MSHRFFPPLREGCASPDHSLRASLRSQPKPPQFSHHLLALRRGVLFAAATVALVAPMAVAARHAEAELTLVRCWPLDLSAPGPRTMALPVLRADSGLR